MVGRQAGFFDLDERLSGLSRKGDVLERLKGTVRFELFRGDLEKAVPRADGKPQVDLAVPAFGYKNHISTNRRYMA